ncbi:hypothetical protein C1646_505985 [Rhizophagus diaphanus]|nr:hypothetical protein C1646_505985 [Rhizophagus diaphanus] [Rhizophagus sp. MUCL 43196]
MKSSVLNEIIFRMYYVLLKLFFNNASLSIIILRLCVNLYKINILLFIQHTTRYILFTYINYTYTYISDI